MATPAALLFRHTFDGAGYPDFTVTWPGFSFPDSGQLNALGRLRPVVDGFGRGFASRTIGGVEWLGVSDYAPASHRIQARAFGKWKNAGGAADREVVLAFRVRDVDNKLELRLRSRGALGNPELRLFKVLAGVATQVGGTVTHALISATKLEAGTRWGVAVEDLDDGTTRVRGYVGCPGPQDGTTRGTLVLTELLTVPSLRGPYTVGLGLRDSVYLDDVRVDDLEVYDQADEWDPSATPPAPGAGWQVVIEGQLYEVNSQGFLNGLDPAVKLVSVRQAYGLKGNTATLTSVGDWRMGAVLKPGREVIVYHDGAVRFRGWVESGQQSTSSETVTWRCYDGHFAARQVSLREDSLVPGHLFNVADTESDDYRPDRQGMTLGQIGIWLFTRYLARLRFYGSAPATSVPYVQAEWLALDAVIPDLAVTGTFVSAIEILLKYVAYKWQVWWDPGDRVWHLVDVTSLSAETIAVQNGWVQFTLNPDRTKAYTAVEWIGGLKERDDDLTLSLSAGTLRPTWTPEMEGAWKKDKGKRTAITFPTNTAAGTAVGPDGLVHCYIDVPVGTLDNDDVKGWLCSVLSAGHLVIANTSTRLWLDPSAWGVVPGPNDSLTLTATDPDAAREYSAWGVGRSFYYSGPVTLCTPFAGVGAEGAHQRGFCGKAWVVTKGDDGKSEFGEEYQYELRFPTDTARNAGFCDPLATLSAVPKPSVGLINKAAPKGSVPQGSCVPGVSNAMTQKTLVDVQLRIPKDKATAPRVRRPTGEDTFEGTAFTDWGSRQVYTVFDNDFTDQAAQEVGIGKAAQYVLDVKKERPYMLELERAAPWHVTTPEFPTRAPTNTFAGLSKRLLLSSNVRPTGTLEADERLSVFAVTWNVEGNSETIEAGSASGWLEVSGIDVAEAISGARILKKALSEVKRLEDFRNRMLGKAADRIGGQPGAPTDGCDVLVSNEQNKRVVDVQKDDADKIQNITHQAFREQLDTSLVMGIEPDFPGAPIGVPGRDGAAAMQDLGGAVLGSKADPTIPFQGPALGPGGARGRYDGQIVTDAALEGKAPRTVRRYAGFAWRKREDASGNPDGGPGLEYAALDTAGNPTGPWTAYRRPTDLPGGRVPLSAAGAGSLTGQLLERTRELARKLGALESITGHIYAPGEGSGGGGGAPADLASALRAQGLFPYLDLVPASFSDPGGLVWAGPKKGTAGQGGANAGLFWRIRVPEMILVRVTPATPGTGTHGGAWNWDTSGPGGTSEFMSHGSVIHKQLMPGDLQLDVRHPGAAAAMAPVANPFGFVQEGLVLGIAGAVTGAGGIFTIPKGARGTPRFGAVVKEDPNGVPVVIGQQYRFVIDWSYQATPWTAVGAGAANDTTTSDGANTGTNLFYQPGGAVPPGLRAVALSAVYAPGAAAAPAAPANATVVLMGLEVDVAVVEGGYALRFTEGMTFSETWGHNHPAMHEVLSLVEAWSNAFTKGISESLSFDERWFTELNPPLEIVEGFSFAESWSLLATLALADSMAFTEEWHAELNGVPVF